MLFVHAVRRSGFLYLEYWEYLPDSRTAHTGIAALDGSHADDWEGLIVKLRPDGVVVGARASAHLGWAGRHPWWDLAKDDWAPYPATVYRAAGSHAGSFKPAGVDIAGDAWNGNGSVGGGRPAPRRPGGAGRRAVRPGRDRSLGQAGLERPRGGHHRPAGEPRGARQVRPMVGHGVPDLPRTLVPFKLAAPPADKRDAMPRTSKELLNLALDLLPEMPGTVEVYAQDGGVFNLMLAAIEGDMIYAYGDRNHVRDGLTLTWQQRNQEGDGHNVRFTIQRTFFQSGAELLLHLYVSSIEDHFASRTAPRARVSVPAYLQVLYGREIAPGEQLDIRLADVSRTGVSFITNRVFQSGDKVEISAELPQRLVRMEARVVTQIPAIYGRNRVGCEITDMLEADRHWINELARVTKEQGSEDDRRPDVAERLEAARDATTAENQPQRPARRYPFA